MSIQNIGYQSHFAVFFVLFEFSLLRLLSMGLLEVLYYLAKDNSEVKLSDVLFQDV